MQSRRIEIEIPSSLAGYLPMDDAHVKTRLEKLSISDVLKDAEIIGQMPGSRGYNR